MTTIRSHFGKKFTIGYRGDGEVQIECGPDHDNTGNHVRIYKLDDLKAALGIDELGCGCDEADDNLKAAIRRAEDAEAFGAAAVARAEEAEAEALEQAKLVRTWADRAEKAEALVARVQRLRDVSGDTVGVEELDAILGDPPFELPTEAGAVILATGRGNKQHYELHRTTTGRWITPGVREDWDDERVLSAFTDHRLIGADE